jgi:hypothetical protein
MNHATLRISKSAKGLARLIDKNIETIAGEKIGFSLVIYTQGRASYIGNIDRKDAIRELSTLLELWKADMPDVPAHEYQG